MTREFELNKEIELSASPEQVWQAITTPEGMTAWFAPMDPIEGGAEVSDPPRRLVIRTPLDPDGSGDAFEYLIEARDGGSCVLQFVHSGFRSDDWSDEYEDTTDAGWDLYLHTLAEYLGRFAGRPAYYVSAEAPPESADARRWPALLTALGLSATSAVGDPVRLSEPEPIDGVVDYVHPQYVGIRTADALYRFHGRWPLGLPIAVGHHIYRADERAEAEQASKVWATWLAEVMR